MGTQHETDEPGLVQIYRAGELWLADAAAYEWILPFILFLIKFKMQCGVSFALFWFEECFECSQWDTKNPLRVNGGKMSFQSLHAA